MRAWHNASMLLRTSHAPVATPEIAAAASVEDPPAPLRIAVDRKLEQLGAFVEALLCLGCRACRVLEQSSQANGLTTFTPSNT